MIEETYFTQLFEENRFIILHHIRKLHLYENHDEYYQIGCIALWKAANSYNPDKGSSFSTYAYAVIRGHLLSELKKSKKLQQRYEPTENIEVTENNALEDEQLYVESVLVNLHESLTEKQMKWLNAYVKEGKSPKEIAVQENVAESAVKAWRRDALKKLAKMKGNLDIR
ncbi:sigma-70 family RNA polymerase sigma factor [Metabacillus lacus]|uniref:sigma-70 family RNA polymerase sigma factor n=1 Tax=Metabacillus lacus TaxID=1983721 RepID=UPI0012AF4BBA|nr:sigma-70 family RNA polymerase sigma factor [Metabacillus lacus]